MFSIGDDVIAYGTVTGSIKNIYNGRADVIDENMRLWTSIKFSDLRGVVVSLFNGELLDAETLLPVKGYKVFRSIRDSL